MMQAAGVWLPDGDDHLVEYFSKVAPVDGHGAYQHEKWTAAIRYITQWRTALDVGAHVGLWTMMLAKRFASVICFEPMPIHRECWLKNLPLILPDAIETTPTGAPGGVRTFTHRASARHVTLHPVALGAAEGEADLALEREGWSGCTRIIGAEETVALAGPRVRVPVRRLDDYALTGIDFVKIDCEGFERFVLEGGAQLIRRERPTVLVEQKPGLAQRFGLPETGAVGFLTTLGARVRWTMAGDYLLTFNHGGRR